MTTINGGFLLSWKNDEIVEPASKKDLDGIIKNLIKNKNRPWKKIVEGMLSTRTGTLDRKILYYLKNLYDKIPEWGAEFSSKQFFMKLISVSKRTSKNFLIIFIVWFNP